MSVAHTGDRLRAVVRIGSLAAVAGIGYVTLLWVATGTDTLETLLLAVLSGLGVTWALLVIAVDRSLVRGGDRA